MSYEVWLHVINLFQQVYVKVKLELRAMLAKAISVPVLTLLEDLRQETMRH